MTYRLSSLLVLGLLVLPVAPFALAGDEAPPADEVAQWILAGDDADVRQALRALDGAPTSYLAEVVAALRRQAKGNVFPDEPPPPELVAESRARVFLEMEVWRVPQGTSAALFGANDPSMAGYPTVQYLEASELTKLRETLGALDGVEGNQTISIFVENEKEASFAATDEVEVPGQEAGADRSLSEGLTFSVRPHLSTDKRFVTLEMDLRHLTVKRPLTATVPVVAEHPSRMTLRLPDGAGIALSGFPDDGPPHRERIALLKVAVLLERQPDVVFEFGSQDAPQTFINVEAKILEVANERLEAVLGVRVPDAQDPWRLLEPREVLGLLGTARAGAEGVTVLHAPQLTTYDGQTANVSMLSQTSYVKDFDVKEKDGESMLDPIIATIQDGLVLEVTPKIAEDRKGIDLEILATLAELFRPIAEFRTEMAGQQVTIQMPELRVSRSRAHCQVPPGRHVLIGGLGEGDEGRRFVMIRTTLVTVDDVTPK